MERRHFVSLPLATLPLASTTKRYRVAVIGHTGRGNYGHGIDTVWRAFENMELVAISDADESGRAAAAKRLAVTNTYSDYREMLEKQKDIDAVIIATPDHTHAVIAMAAIRAGKHVYVAKPIAVDVPGCQSIAASGQKATQKKLVFLVDFQTRAHPAYQEAVKLVHEGKIGRLISGEATYQCPPAREERKTEQRSRAKRLPSRRVTDWTTSR